MACPLACPFVLLPLCPCSRCKSFSCCKPSQAELVPLLLSSWACLSLSLCPCALAARKALAARASPIALVIAWYAQALFSACSCFLFSACPLAPQAELVLVSSSRAWAFLPLPYWKPSGKPIGKPSSPQAPLGLLLPSCSWQGLSSPQAQAEQASPQASSCPLALKHKLKSLSIPFVKFSI